MLLLAAALTAGCGGDDGEEGTGDLPAPPSSDFPSAEGRTLNELLAEASAGEVVVSPAGEVFRKGKSRFGFGVFTPARGQITDAAVAIYAAPAGGGTASGPFPARIESMETEPEFTSRTTADDPDAAAVVYVAEIEFDEEGKWDLIALVREDGSVSGTRIPTITVGGNEAIPGPGDRPPRVHTPTADEVADISEIETRDPPDSMHEEDLADVLGEKPVVLVFATPLLCVSRVCGPVVDVAEQVKAEHGDDVAFIHMEIYRDNLVQNGLRPQVTAYHLRTEPWLFVIDREGRVSTALEGAWGIEDLEKAVEKVAGDQPAS